MRSSLKNEKYLLTLHPMKKDKMNINKVIESLFRPFRRENVLFFSLMYLLGLTSIVFEPWNGSRFWMTFELFFDVYIYSMFIFLFPSRYRHYVRCASAVFFYILAVVDMACYVRLDMPITPILLQLLLQSNTREATEALTSYLDCTMLWSPLSLVIAQSIIGIYLLFREKRLSRYCSRWVFVKSERTRRAIMTGILLIVAFSGVSCIENKEYMYYRVIRQYSELETLNVKEFSKKTNFYIPIYRLAYSMSETQRLRGEIEQFERSLYMAKIDAVDYRSPHIVVIIGESYNRHHSALYGYDKNTTPLQCKRLAKGEMVLFTDMISSWNTTCESFKNMFSTQYVGQGGSWASAPPFPFLFKEAGYHTSFLSNQYVVGNVGFSAFVEDAFFNNPHTSSKMFDCRNKATHTYDVALIEDYAKQKNEKYPYTLDIFHFLGLHADFKMRYPSSYSKFSASDYERRDLTVDSRQIIAEYDNAVLYNDFVVDSILRLYEDKEAIVVYVPDHGERVFDNSKEWGRNLTWNKNDIRQQFDIPFWVWASSEYRRRHQDIWLEIQKAAPKRGMTDAIAQMLLHIAGIHTKWYSPEVDMLNAKYNERRKRIIRGERDYDEIVGK